MKIISLYKIWRGKELLTESIESNYHHVDGMVFVSSEISWTGKKGNNTREVVSQWKEKYDYANKIHIVDFNTIDQKEQYVEGVRTVRQKFPDHDWIQVVDSDEVWNEEAWVKSIGHFHNEGGLWPAFRCAMITYMKTRNIIIEGKDCVKPIAFVKAGFDYINCRFSNVRSLFMNDVIIDHYGLVRDSWQEIYDKIHNCQVGDGVTRLVDMNRWKKEVWDKAPDGECYHYYVGCENLWTGFSIKKE